MIEIADAAPHVEVDPDEYLRLLGYPPGFVLEGRVSELEAWARGWYASNGRPWVHARATGRFALDDGTVSVEGTRLHASRLHDRLRRARAHEVIVVAVSAGRELEIEAQRLWRDDRPDEYFFLEMFGSAVVEHLITAAGARLCAWADPQGMAVLPHDSPGYSGWDVVEQPALLALMRAGGTLPGPIDALESGALVPKKSQLAVFGVTRHLERLQHLTGLVPCQSCSLAGCQYRRRPYGRAGRVADTGSGSSARAARRALRAGGSYRVSTKALRRWARDRLSIETRADGGIDALFRYDGTTCTNMGRELTFYYRVSLGPAEDGYPILDQQCAPAPDDAGHTAMCAYVRNRDALCTAIATERPLAGRPLDDVLSWQPSQSSAGCYCDPASREHKWGLVLETIHFALAGGA
jgi:hypothetical protein